MKTAVTEVSGARMKESIKAAFRVRLCGCRSARHGLLDEFIVVVNVVTATAQHYTTGGILSIRPSP